MNNQSTTTFITRTAILLGLALIFQIGFRAFAQPLVGPLVNFVLIFSTILVGTSSGIIIGSLTPLIAFMVGIMPLFPVVPFIMVGNALYVVTFNSGKGRLGTYGEYLAFILAAFVKFAFLSFSIRYLVTLFVPVVPPPMIAALSLPQLTTALVGGGLAVVVAKAVTKAMRSSEVRL